MSTGKRILRATPLNQALARQSTRSNRAVCCGLIDGCQAHLDACRRNRCVKCSDAKTLIPFYRECMKKRPPKLDSLQETVRNLKRSLKSNRTLKAANR